MNEQCDGMPKKINFNNKSLRIFHGPVNIGGIGGYLASYQREHGHDAQFIVWRKNKFLLNHDVVVFDGPSKVRLRDLITRVRCALVWGWRFDVFNFYFGATLLPYSLDLPLLRLMGKRIVMTYCGSDVRLVRVERERNPFWQSIESDLIGTMDDVKFDRKKKLMMMIQGFFCHKILAPRNLFEPVSRYVRNNKIVSDVWVHNLSFTANTTKSDLSKNIALNAGSTNRLPRLLHMPSSAVVKGTKYFREAILMLKEEGLEFDYVEVMDTEHSQAVLELKKSDVVLDQLLLGGFGSLSVEGMFYGKPVVCYLIDSVKREHYNDCPIVNANLDTLKIRMKELILDVALRKSLGESGQSFVSKHFDYVTINEKMLSLYQNQ